MYDFRLSTEQFWELTFPQFAALAERHDLALERLDHQAGVVASTVANCHRGADSKPFLPKQFMPSYDPAGDAAVDAADAPMGGDEMLGFFMAMFPPPPDVKAKLLTPEGRG